MGLVFSSPAEALAATGRDLGTSGWILVDQERIDAFAKATGDFQWIHVDRERAKHGPYGSCIAHGYLTLSLVNMILPELIAAEGMKMGVNYGCDRVRFPAVVRAGSRLRGSGEVLKAEALAPDAVQIIVRVTMHIENESKPACVVDIVSRYYF